ncbi:MAG: ankyrin repeat domain-containing protein [Acidobacteriaceae bacterium]
MTYRGAQNLIKRGDEPALRAALEAGLDPNLTNQNGWTLLMLAAVEGDVAIGRLLIEKDADQTSLNNKQDSALTLASHRGHQLFADLLTNSGASTT